MTHVPKTTSCKQIFKSLHILPLPSLYIYERLIYIKSNLNNFATNLGLHSYNTRIKDDLHIVPCNTSLCKNNSNNVGLWMLNHLPRYIKEISVLHKFKIALTHTYIHTCIHTLHYITLHYMDLKLIKMTVGCGIGHTNTKHIYSTTGAFHITCICIHLLLSSWPKAVHWGCWQY
jgi:hypothetical protein